MFRVFNFAILVFLLPQVELAHLRSTRSLGEFEFQVWCATGSSGIRVYNNHGCWCGYGGKGDPIDSIDNCCKLHDECYGRSTHLCSGSGDKYFTRYDWQCLNETDSDFTNRTPICNEVANSENPCASALCDCDRSAAMCFAKYEIPESTQDCPQQTAFQLLISGLSSLRSLFG